MSKPPSITGRLLIRVLLKIGFVHIHGSGSHLFFANPDGRKTTVPVHGKDIPLGTLRAIIKDLHMSVEEFKKLLKSV
jgi:predicted RNA binding protein YcfA (HicA-like mRNA interferase family)